MFHENLNRLLSLNFCFHFSSLNVCSLLTYSVIQLNLIACLPAWLLVWLLVCLFACLSPVIARLPIIFYSEIFISFLLVPVCLLVFIRKLQTTNIVFFLLFFALFVFRSFHPFLCINSFCFDSFCL